MLFKKYKYNPVIIPDYKNRYENSCTYNPCATVYNNKVYLFYRAEDYPYGISKICLAISNDGYHFNKFKDNPIIKPTRAEEKMGCEDPRITKIDGTFYLTYTSYDGKYPLRFRNINLSVATSKDLIHWRKRGVLIKNNKSGVIVNEKIKNRYIMFIGGKQISIARSKDLKTWTLDKRSILKPTKNLFNNEHVERGPFSPNVEIGPPPIIFEDKIFLIYNISDTYFRFRPSFCILNRSNPNKVIYKSNKPLLTPSEQFELFGKTNNVIFAEGLVEFKNKYFLYYGAADKYIGVATVSKDKLIEFIKKF